MPSKFAGNKCVICGIVTYRENQEEWRNLCSTHEEELAKKYLKELYQLKYQDDYEHRQSR
jgi:hypothetical protein